MYVKTYSTLNSEFIEKWTNCLKERQQMLQKPDLTTFEYLENFPIFNTNDNSVFDLLAKDVSCLYPTYCSIRSWDHFYKNVFKHLSVTKDLSAQNLLKCSENTNEGNLH